VNNEARLLRGALYAQDERERQAGDKCGVSWQESGCDWPDAVAEKVLALTKERDALRTALHTFGRHKPECPKGYWVDAADTKYGAVGDCIQCTCGLSATLATGER
jgi:hypothetical protein